MVKGAGGETSETELRRLPRREGMTAGEVEPRKLLRLDPIEGCFPCEPSAGTAELDVGGDSGSAGGRGRASSVDVTE